MAGLRVFANSVRLDWHGNDLIFDVVFPKWRSLRNFEEGLHGLLSCHSFVKRIGGDVGLGREARVVMALLEVLRFQLTTFLSVLLYALLKFDFQSVRPLDLIVAPFIIHDTLIAIDALLQGLPSQGRVRRLLDKIDFFISVGHR